MNDLLAGAGGARITPPIGCPMGGYGARDHGAEGVHDHLNTHALFLDDGSTQAVIIANDLLGMRAEQVARVRELVHAATGVPAAHVFLAFSHTHGGPQMYSDFSALEEQVCHLYRRGELLHGRRGSASGHFGGARALGHGPSSATGRRQPPGATGGWHDPHRRQLPTERWHLGSMRCGLNATTAGHWR